MSQQGHHYIVVTHCPGSLPTPRLKTPLSSRWGSLLSLSLEIVKLGGALCDLLSAWPTDEAGLQLCVCSFKLLVLVEENFKFFANFSNFLFSSFNGAALTKMSRYYVFTQND